MPEMTREEFITRYQQLQNPTYIDLPDEAREHALKLMRDRAPEYGLPLDFAERIRIIEVGPPLTPLDAEREAELIAPANELDIEAMMPSAEAGEYDAAQRGYEETPETAREAHLQIMRELEDAANLYSGVFGMRSKPTPGARSPLTTIYLQESRLDDRGPIAIQRTLSGAPGPAKGYLQSENSNTAETIMTLIKAARGRGGQGGVGAVNYVQQAMELTEDEDTLANLRELNEIVRQGVNWYSDYKKSHGGAAPGGAEYEAELLENVQRIQDIKSEGDPAFDAFLHLVQINAEPAAKTAYDEMRRTSASNTSALLENINVIQRAGKPIREEELRRLIQETEGR